MTSISLLQLYVVVVAQAIFEHSAFIYSAAYSDLKAYQFICIQSYPMKYATLENGTFIWGLKYKIANSAESSASRYGGTFAIHIQTPQDAVLLH